MGKNTIHVKRKLAVILKATKRKIENCSRSKNLRLNNNAFTRESRLGPKRLLHLILHRIYCSLQLHLDDYFDGQNEMPVSRQAFSKARQNLNPEYVRSFVDASSEIAASDEAKSTYNGMTLIAIDGSDIALENTAELKEAFGCSGPKRDAATALTSIAYDPLNSNIYDCRIGRYETDERTLARRHITRLLELNLGGSLLLFDRGYPSAEFVSYLYETGFHFVMRLRSKFNLEADAIETQGWIDLSHEGQPVPVRVLKVTLSTGEVETLITSLNQKQLPMRNAGALYFERWKVETAYDLIKSTLELESFSGKTEVTVLQDYYATMYLANLVAFAAEEADEVISETDAVKDGLKYKRKASRSRITNKLRKRFLQLIMLNNERALDKALDDLVAMIVRYPVDIVSGRSPVRKPPRSKRFYQARRSVL